MKTNKPRIIVCGGRDFGHMSLFPSDEEYLPRMAEYDFIKNTLTDMWVHYDWKDPFIIAGGATGADTVAIEWAKEHNLEFKEYKAKWKVYGNAAGPIRNREMLEMECPDLVIAFPGKTGTQNMIDISRKAGVQVLHPIFRYTMKVDKNG